MDRLVLKEKNICKRCGKQGKKFLLEWEGKIAGYTVLCDEHLSIHKEKCPDYKLKRVTIFFRIKAWLKSLFTMTEEEWEYAQKVLNCLFGIEAKEANKIGWKNWRKEMKCYIGYF